MVDVVEEKVVVMLMVVMFVVVVVVVVVVVGSTRDELAGCGEVGEGPWPIWPAWLSPFWPRRATQSGKWASRHDFLRLLAASGRTTLYRQIVSCPRQKERDYRQNRPSATLLPGHETTAGLLFQSAGGPAHKSSVVTPPTLSPLLTPPSHLSPSSPLHTTAPQPHASIRHSISTTASQSR